MNVILMRHGPDLPRPGGENRLSKQGKEKVHSMSMKIRASGLHQIDRCVHSPALRAEETVQELSNVLVIASQEPSRSLAPGKSPTDLEMVLYDSWTIGHETVLLVGHEPQLSHSVLAWATEDYPDELDESSSNWIMSRAEAMCVSPKFDHPDIKLTFTETKFFGRPRALPSPSLNNASAFS